MLLGSTLLVAGGTDPVPAAAVRSSSSSRPGLRQRQPAAAAERSSCVLPSNKPDPAEQKQLWQEALGDGAMRSNGALDGIASQFRLSARTIRRGRASRADAGCQRSARPRHVVSRRTVGRSKLDELAQRIESAADWDDLVLPERAKGHAAPDRRARAAPAQGPPRMGLRRQGRARPGHQRAVRGRERHRQDDGRRSACRRAAARSLPHRSVGGRQQVHRRDREEPAPRVRRRRRERRDPAVRRGRRAVRQAQRGARTATTATPTSRSATCCSAWRRTAGSRSSPPT